MNKDWITVIVAIVLIAAYYLADKIDNKLEKKFNRKVSDRYKNSK
jgi:hypothetical protein